MLFLVSGISPGVALLRFFRRSLHALVGYAREGEVAARRHEFYHRFGDVQGGVELLLAFFHEFALERRVERVDVAEVHDVVFSSCKCNA